MNIRKQVSEAILKALNDNDEVKYIENHPRAWNYDPDFSTNFFFKPGAIFDRIGFDYKAASYSGKLTKNWIFVNRHISNEYHDPESGNPKDNFQVECLDQAALAYALNMLYFNTKKVKNKDFISV